MIKLEHLYKTYQQGTQQVEALHDVSLVVPEGKISGIIGKSGAGKSSLIRCINFLERPDRGKVIINGVDLFALNPAQLRAQRRKMGMIFQQFNLLSSKTVYDNVALPLVLLGIDKSTIKQKVLSLLELTHLSEKINAYPAQLSGGQKQRVGIARALANDPSILLCDEATSALDPETTSSILNLLKTINETLGITILLITHEIEVVKALCHSVSVLEKGRLIEHSDILTLFTSPQTETAKKLIHTALKLDLPDTIQRALHIEKSKPGAMPVLQIKFIGTATNEPIISNMAHKFGVQFNILQANIEIIAEQTIGSMVVQIIGDEDKTKLCLEYLKTHLDAEVVGYASY